MGMTSLLNASEALATLELTARAELVHAASADNTRRAYASDWKFFAAFVEIVALYVG